MVNIVVRQDFGLEFLAKAKPLKAKAKASLLEGQGQGQVLTSLHGTIGLLVSVFASTRYDDDDDNHDDDD